MEEVTETETKIVALKAELFDIIRKLQFINTGVEQLIEIKTKKLNELTVLETEMSNPEKLLPEK